MIHQAVESLEGDNLVQTTNAQKAKIDKLINSSDFYLKEKVWAYLMANILVKSSNRNDYIKLFCNESISIYPNTDVWFEAEPLSVRKDSIGNTEGNISIDLAFGNVKRRDKTKVGIEYEYVEKGSWVCFVEAKLFTDCRSYITCDSLKNQIVHIIENLLCFQENGNFPEKLFFTLLTPRFFKEYPESRFYGYKIKEYVDVDKIINDIRRSKIPERHQQDWNYPDNLEERVKLLKINWITFEEILGDEYTIKNLDLTNLTQPTIEIFKKILEKLISKDQI
jgi:hypothetical protein